MSNASRGGSRRRRGRFRPRSATLPARRAGEGSDGSSPRSRATRPSRLTLALYLLGGVLLGSFAHVLPMSLFRLVEFTVVAGFALVAALSYRRWVRGLIEERRRRERDQRAAE